MSEPSVKSLASIIQVQRETVHHKTRNYGRGYLFTVYTRVTITRHYYNMIKYIHIIIFLRNRAAAGVVVVYLSRA